MTIRNLAHLEGVTLGAIRKRIRRAQFQPPGNDEPIPEEVLQKILPSNGQQPKPAKLNGQRKPPKPPKKEKPPKFAAGFADFMRMAPLPMLGLALSYGVYHFASHFMPPPFPFIEAAGIVLIYIGLATLRNLSKADRLRATWISIGAVAVDVIYNTLSAALYQDPQIFDKLEPWLFWLLCFGHGFPIAVLLFFVAGLLLHRKSS